MDRKPIGYDAKKGNILEKKTQKSQKYDHV